MTKVSFGRKSTLYDNRRCAKAGVVDNNRKMPVNDAKLCQKVNLVQYSAINDNGSLRARGRN